MVILKCDKCGLTEEHKYFKPKLIKNIDKPDDYHGFWYIMVSGSGSYISGFPLSEFFVEDVGGHLCMTCYEKWQKYKAEQQGRIKELYKEFMPVPGRKEA